MNQIAQASGFNGVAAMQAGAEGVNRLAAQTQGIEAAKVQQATQLMSTIGNGMLHAFNGNPNGPVDPAKYEEVLDGLESVGIPAQSIAAFRGRPEMAGVALKQSMGAINDLKLARTDRDFDFAVQKFERGIMESDRAAGMQQQGIDLQQQRVDLASQPAAAKPSSPLGKLASDFQAGLIDQETYEAAVKRATETKNGITVSKDGTVRIGGSGKPPTEGQAKANIYASRGEKAENILSELETEGTDLSNAIASRVPLAGNYLVSDEYRRYDQAKRDFINATLRQESGAVIADTEFANAEKQYFPQPGDDPATIEQKKANRATAMKAIRQASGPFANGDPSEPRTFNEMRELNGKTYGKDADGTWYEVN